MKQVEKEISVLRPTKLLFEKVEIAIEHTMLCTMIDSKVRQALIGTASSQRCCICDALPKEMNNLTEILKKPVNIGTYHYGLSTLHAWIRNMEWILHLAYKLPLKKWNVQFTDDEKEVVENTKHQIQTGIRDKLGLLVDAVKQVAGNTNDGNTARKFFQNYNNVAEITGIDQYFIKRLYIIMQDMASGKTMDVNKFKKYCMDTAKIYVNKYMWYPMPSSCHMILIHVSDVIETFLNPIGQLWEETKDARNKDIKRCRENNTHKSTPIYTNEDIIHFLLISSHPYVCSLRHVQKHKSKICFQKHKSYSSNKIPLRKSIRTKFLLNKHIF